jgi:CRP/FNR family transcriptional regulator
MELHKAWEQTRLLALAPSSRAKLAQLLLVWAEQHGQRTSEGVRVPLHMTQEAIGEAIGATRETVSRLLGDFRRHRWIRLQGASVLLLQPDQLRALGAG